MDIQNTNNKTLNVDISDYWMILKKRLFLVIFIFLTVLSAVVFYTIKQKSVYQSRCMVKISSRQPMATIRGGQITWYGSSGNSLAAEITLMKNKSIILETTLSILQKRINSPFLKGANKEYYKEYLDEITKISFSMQEQAYLNSLNKGVLANFININIVPQSNIISINASGPYTSVVTNIVNVLAMVYRADYWKNKTQEARETRDFIGQQIERIKMEIEKTKDELKQISQKNNFLGTASIYQDELTNALIEHERLKEKYKETHPKIIKHRRIIDAIKKRLENIPGVNRRYSELQTQYEEKTALRKLLGEHYLKADIDYEAKRSKAKDEISIISKANSASKLRPNEQMNITVGALFGLILGCILAFVWEGFDTSIGKIEDVEHITGMPVIAHIPLLGKEDIQKKITTPITALLNLLLNLFYGCMPFKRPLKPRDLEKKILLKYDSLSMTAEAYRTLRTNIQFAVGTLNQTGYVIAITSASPREGKTLTASNLAIALAQMGKSTLLLEADMRNPRIAPLFKIDKHPGLSDLLIGTVKQEATIRTFTDILMGNSKWDELVDTQGIDNLHILPCGTLPPNPSELLLSQSFKDLIENLKKEYDYVIIDTPPTLPVSDSSIVGTIADGSILVYQSDTTSRHLLLRAIQTLQKSKTNILGIVINQLSFDVVIRSGNTYSYHHEQD
ncbi:MAG: polysaccharide biosynthesis tyrosine autokinase [Verrucomicrobiota bacterium]|nr:polysaccharide biosynthesis tyrosine autokinase [Verrucomicrobiota bacterium]